VSRKWMVIIAVLVIDLIVAVTVVAILVDRNRDEARRAAAIAATSTTGVTSPYDFAELPPDTDLETIETASFVSILIPNAAGKPTSYGVSADLPAAWALIAAIRGAEELDDDAAATVATAGNAITFVLPTRQTVAFALDLEQGLVARGGRAWRPEAELSDLVAAAVAEPQ